MMPKTRRKEALRKRASDYADRYTARRMEENHYPLDSNDVFVAYQDGYRAAMRDARAAWDEEPSHTMSVENLLEFLRPLR